MNLSHQLALHAFGDGRWLADRELFRARQSHVADLELDETTIEAHVGFLAVDWLAFSGSHFDRDIQGVERQRSVIVGVLDHHERLFDLLAWPIGAPSCMATLGGTATMLGETQAYAHPPTCFALPLPVHRTAEAWLRAGCLGVVPLDRRRFAEAFLLGGGALRAEDDAHACELDDARREVLSEAARIVVAREAA